MNCGDYPLRLTRKIEKMPGDFPAELLAVQDRNNPQIFFSSNSVGLRISSSAADIRSAGKKKFIKSEKKKKKWGNSFWISPDDCHRSEIEGRRAWTDVTETVDNTKFLSFFQGGR